MEGNGCRIISIERYFTHILSLKFKKNKHTYPNVIQTREYFLRTDSGNYGGFNKLLIRF